MSTLKRSFEDVGSTVPGGAVRHAKRVANSKKDFLRLVLNNESDDGSPEDTPNDRFGTAPESSRSSTLAEPVTGFSSPARASTLSACEPSPHSGPSECGLSSHEICYGMASFNCTISVSCS